MGFPIIDKDLNKKSYYKKVVKKLKKLANNITTVDPITQNIIIDTDSIIKNIFKSRRPTLRYVPDGDARRRRDGSNERQQTKDQIKKRKRFLREVQLLELDKNISINYSSLKKSSLQRIQMSMVAQQSNINDGNENNQQGGQHISRLVRIVRMHYLSVAMRRQMYGEVDNQQSNIL